MLTTYDVLCLRSQNGSILEPPKRFFNWAVLIRHVVVIIWNKYESTCISEVYHVVHKQRSIYQFR